MPLSDAQIDRYSRQIILPEIGGAGQLRLLGGGVAVHGATPLVALAARYLAGAGVGRLWLATADDAAALRDELAALNPDCAVTLGTTSPAAAATLALGLPLPALDALVRAGAPRLIAAGLAGPGGWLFTGPAGCAACAARAGAAPGHAGLLAAPAAGVLASLAALAALRVLLALDGDDGAVWWRFDADGAALEPRPLARVAGCGGCGAPT